METSRIVLDSIEKTGRIKSPSEIPWEDFSGKIVFQIQPEGSEPRNISGVNDIILAEDGTTELWSQMTDAVFDMIRDEQKSFFKLESSELFEDKYVLGKYMYELVMRNGYFFQEQTREKYGQQEAYL